MAINFTAQLIVPTIKAFGYHKSDELWSFHIDGLEFNIDNGVVGFIHPVAGWTKVHDFVNDDHRHAIPMIQWAVDTYGNKENNK